MRVNGPSLFERLAPAARVEIKAGLPDLRGVKVRLILDFGIEEPVKFSFDGFGLFQDKIRIRFFHA